MVAKDVKWDGGGRGRPALIGEEDEKWEADRQDRTGREGQGRGREACASASIHSNHRPSRASEAKPWKVLVVLARPQHALARSREACGRSWAGLPSMEQEGTPSGGHASVWSSSPGLSTQTPSIRPLHRARGSASADPRLKRPTRRPRCTSRSGCVANPPPSLKGLGGPGLQVPARLRNHLR